MYYFIPERQFYISVLSALLMSSYSYSSVSEWDRFLTELWLMLRCGSGEWGLSTIKLAAILNIKYAKQNSYRDI